MARLEFGLSSDVVNVVRPWIVTEFGLGCVAFLPDSGISVTRRMNVQGTKESDLRSCLENPPMNVLRHHEFQPVKTTVLDGRVIALTVDIEAPIQLLAGMLRVMLDPTEVDQYPFRRKGPWVAPLVVASNKKDVPAIESIVQRRLPKRILLGAARLAA